jgi:hypothetical protein
VGLHPWSSYPGIEKRMNRSFNDMVSCVKALAVAINSARWNEIEYAVHALFTKVAQLGRSTAVPYQSKPPFPPPPHLART